eukprot:SAG31_NODE_4081_length_3608_cov_3.369336_2_plen_35_part_00
MTTLSTSGPQVLAQRDQLLHRQREKHRAPEVHFA